MQYATLVLFGYAACAAWGVRSWRRGRGAEPLERFGAAILPLGYFILTGVLVRELLNAPFRLENGARLAPSYGLREGFALYYGASEGPILSVIYAPFSSFFYVLTTFAKEPNSAILTASAFAAVSFLGPCIWLLWRRGSAANPASVKLLTILTFAFVLVESKPVLDAVFFVHGDAQAIGLAALACLLLTAPGAGVKHLTAAAFCAALAVWTKQTFAPLLAAVPLLAWLLTNGRLALVAVAAEAAALAILGGAVACLVDVRAMVFNAVTVPSRHPYHAKLELGPAVFQVAQDFAKNALWPALASIFLATLTARATPGLGWRDRLRAHPGLAVLLTAVALVPTSLAGRMKYGGAEVSFAPTLTLLAAGIALLTLSNLPLGGAFAAAARPALAASAALLALYNAVFPLTIASRIERLSTAPEQEAYEFARRHPGEAYFPWFPLPTILAERKLYHSTYAVYDREIAGFPVNEAHVRSVFPPTLRYMAYKELDVPYLQTHFPEFSKRVELAELPGWIVYAKP
jgi:hypothetical protein